MATNQTVLHDQTVFCHLVADKYKSRNLLKNLMRTEKPVLVKKCLHMSYTYVSHNEHESKK